MTMTNNPTIDGVSREDLKKWRRDLDACQRVIWLAGGFDPAYCTDAQECIAQMDSVLDAPAVERQEPEFPAGAIHNGRAFIDQLESIYAFKEQQGHTLSLCSEWQELVRCFEWLANHATDSQSTIAQLQAENSRVNDAWHDMKRELDLTKARVQELESGRGEPAAYIVEVVDPSNGNLRRRGLHWHSFETLRDTRDFKEWIGENTAREQPLFTAPPAPVAVADENLAYARDLLHAWKCLYEDMRWNDASTFSSTEEFLGRLDATAALNEGRK